VMERVQILQASPRDRVVGIVAATGFSLASIVLVMTLVFFFQLAASRGWVSFPFAVGGSILAALFAVFGAWSLMSTTSRIEITLGHDAIRIREFHIFLGRETRSKMKSLDRRSVVKILVHGDQMRGVIEVASGLDKVVLPRAWITNEEALIRSLGSPGD